jgi:hypothetical protein
VHGPAHEPREVAVDRFPFVIGRAHDASLRLEASGVWNRHLVLALDPVEGLIATAGEGAMVTVDHQPIQQHRPRPGDVLTIGAVQLQILITAASRRATAVWEIAVWFLLLMVGAGEIVIALRILDL